MGWALGRGPGCRGALGAAGPPEVAGVRLTKYATKPFYPIFFLFVGLAKEGGGGWGSGWVACWPAWRGAGGGSGGEPAGVLYGKNDKSQMYGTRGGHGAL